MNILVLDTVYQTILNGIEIEIHEQRLEEFEAIRQEILAYRFGTSGCYEYYFSKNGHRCLEIVANSALLQSAWAKENGVRFLNTKAWDKSFFLSRTKALHPFLNYLRQFHFLVVQQVKSIKPDVLIVKDIHEYPPIVLRQFKQSVGQLVGFCSSSVVDSNNFAEYDLILSSVPANLQIAKDLGIRNKRLFPAFDSRNLEFQSENRDISTSFVGSIYSGTIPILKAALEVDSALQIYAPNPKALQGEPGLLDNYVGNAWGSEMYKIYGRSKITLNRHGAIASNFAANMRLFEATGMGACLLTESRPNLPYLFDPATEVVSYNDLSDLQRKIELVLGSDSLRQRIAEAGQHRCLQQHSYSVRIKEILAAFPINAN
jgi:spore maturation protein CgeB